MVKRIFIVLLVADPDIPFRGGGGGGGGGHEMRLNAKGTIGSFGQGKLIYNKIITPLGISIVVLVLFQTSLIMTG